MENMLPDCLATKPHGPGTPALIQTSCNSTQPHISTSHILLNSTMDLQPVNCVASGTSSLAASRRPCHYTATQLYAAVIITQQQMKIKSRQVNHKPYLPDNTSFDINKYYIYVVL
jgi:hypothetical protein